MRKTIWTIALALGAFVFATTALASWATKFSGTYSVYLDGLHQHGGGHLIFDGSGGVTGTWQVHYPGDAPCTVTFTGTTTAGPLGGEQEEVTGTAQSSCLKKSVAAVFEIEPFDDYAGLIIWTDKPNSAIQSGWGRQQEPAY
jgi:hypothetical protein